MKTTNVVKSIIGGIAAGIGHAAGVDIFSRAKKEWKKRQEEKQEREENKSLKE